MRGIVTPLYLAKGLMKLSLGFHLRKDWSFCSKTLAVAGMEYEYILLAKNTHFEVHVTCIYIYIYIIHVFFFGGYLRA